MKIIAESFAGTATATMRVVELYTPSEQRLVDDPLSFSLLPLGWRALVKFLYLPGLRDLVLAAREKRIPGTLGTFLCRTRYIDDVLRESLSDGLDQVVILGAGFDSRAYRIAGMEGVHVFEADLPGTVELKQVRIKRVLGAVPEHVSLVGMNFEEQDLADSLAAAGYLMGKRTLFIWEGVTQYLSAKAVSHTLRVVTRIAGGGSEIVFSYVLKGIIDGTARPEWFQPLLSFAGKVGSQWKFGLEQTELEGYLALHGLRLIDDVGAAEYQARYLKPLGREMNLFAGERVAFAALSG